MFSPGAVPGLDRGPGHMAPTCNCRPVRIQFQRCAWSRPLYRDCHPRLSVAKRREGKGTQVVELGRL